MRIDAHRFEHLLEEGRRQAAAGQLADARDALREALALWRGEALADLAYEPFARSEIERLEELRVAGVEERLEADLALGGAREVIGELRDLVGHHPLRERLRGQLMLALYRCGRQAEALELYQDFRRTLSGELGLEPSPGLRRLELAILARDPILDPPAAAKTPDAIERGQPKASAERARRRRRPVVLVAGALVLVFVLVGVVVASSGGRAPAVVIPGDAVGVVSPSGGAIRTVVALGSSPLGLAAGGGAVWVANPNQGTVSRIDPVERAVVQTIPVGSSPTALVVGAGAVWVTNYLGQTVSRIDPSVDRCTVAVSPPPGGARCATARWLRQRSRSHSQDLR